MRSKKLTVRIGLLTVLLVTLSLASTSDALTLYRVDTPKISWYPTWRGAAVVYMSCDTPGATIKYTWTSGTDVYNAPNPTYFSRTYWIPLYVTRDAVIKAKAYKSGMLSSHIRWLSLDFWPFED
jgi:hypothetical protein